MSSKSHTHRRCGILRKKLFSTSGYVEIHLQRPLFDNKKGIHKIVVLKIQMMETCFGASSTYRVFFKIKIKLKYPIFGGNSSFLKLIVFGQILTKFGSFGLF
jgi:hypothetical protein